ncbi:hypothetical protein BSKO_03538 [Bryopsis sp. KO-2023]|nr:hypothetical protein BSKO_03538 [Bryopsis sp. KO-2023]
MLKCTNGGKLVSQGSLRPTEYRRSVVRCSYLGRTERESSKKLDGQKRTGVLPPARLSVRDLGFESRQNPALLQNLQSWWQEISESCEQRVRSLLTSKYDKQIIGLAGPALLTLAADPLLSIVDTAFVGRLGSNELAALGVNTAIYSLAFVLFNFLATTTTPLIASALSNGDKDKTSQLTFQAFLLSGVLGLSLMGGLFAFSDSTLSIMGAEGEVAVLGKQYLLARAVAAPAAVWCLAGQGVFRGVQDMRTPLMVTLAANGMNLILDPILIYGFHFGVQGAALSTSFAEISSAVAYTVILWSKHREKLGLNCSIQTVVRHAQSDYLPFLSAGGTVLLRTSLLLGTKTLASSVATHLGPISISAHQLVAQLWLLFSLVMDSLAVSGQSLIAVSLGRGDKVSAREMSNRLMELGLSLGLILAMVFTAISPAFPHLFTEDPNIIAQAYAILPMAIFILPINSLAYVLDGIMIGAEDFSFLALSMASTAVVVSSCLLMVEPLGGGLEGVWACQSLLMVMRVGTLAARYNSGEGPIPPLIEGAKAESANAK